MYEFENFFKSFVSVKLFLISCLPKKIARLFFKYDFAFLVHPRDIKDINKYIPCSKFLSRRLKEFIGYHLRPIIISEINLDDKNSNKIKGCIIACPMTAYQLLKFKKKAIRNFRIAVF